MPIPINFIFQSFYLSIHLISDKCLGLALWDSRDIIRWHIKYLLVELDVLLVYWYSLVDLDGWVFVIYYVRVGSMLLPGSGSMSWVVAMSSQGGIRLLIFNCCLRHMTTNFSALSSFNTSCLFVPIVWSARWFVVWFNDYLIHWLTHLVINCWVIMIYRKFHENNCGCFSSFLIIIR